MKSARIVALSVIAVVTAVTVYRSAVAEEVEPSKPAVDRARRTVRMLDDIYKTTVVLITKQYVNSETDFPAGTAAIALLEAVAEKGHPKSRLIDVTGDPYDPKNVAKDDFEKSAVAALRKGRDYYEEIVTEKGRSYLRAATAVPVVLPKCVMCHAHYADVEKGAAIGALTYTVPIE